MEMSFKNGSKVCVPEDVTAIYSSAPTDGPRHAEGVLCGDHRIMAGLIVGMIDKFYNNLTDERKGMFAMAVISIFQNNPAENMTIESMTIVKKNRRRMMMTDMGGRCPAIPGFCVEAWQCRNCALQYGCMKRKTNEARPLRNKKCFRCMYLKAVSMGVACGIKKDR